MLTERGEDVMGGRVIVGVVGMGLSGLVAEVVLLRELLIVFSGNELSIGIIFANWVILEALGSYLFSGRLAGKSRNALALFVGIAVLFSLSFPLSVFLTRDLKNILNVSVGESVGLGTMFLSSFLILLPVSVLHGALFPLSCRIYEMCAPGEASPAGKVYAYETVGTIVGGIACTYLLVPHFHAFQISFGLALLNFAICLALLVSFRATGPSLQAMLVAVTSLTLLSIYGLLGGWAEKWHWSSIRKQWHPLPVVHYQNSPYGNICVIENQGQYIFFQDGVPDLIVPVPDVVSVEEFVHLPMLAHPAPAKILILSGGAGGVINEILKHPTVEWVEYAELDPLILSLLKKFPTPLTELELTDERVQIRHVDGRLLLKTTPHTYDLIFVGIDEPSDLQANRFFTQEFFWAAERRLNEGGILVIGVPGSLTFLNNERRNLNSCVFHTLRRAFSHIRVIPGDGRNLFLSSDSPEILALDRGLVERRLRERNIEIGGLVPWYIENKLHPGWGEWFARFIQESSRKVNEDFRPLGLFYSIALWNAIFASPFGQFFGELERIQLWMVILLLGVLLLAHLFLRSRGRTLLPGIPFAIVTTGFAGMIFDLMVIFGFQAIYGYVFLWIGLLVASFMAGAAVGSLLVTALQERIRNGFRFFVQIELAILLWSLGLPALLRITNAWMGTGAFAISGVLFLIISFIGGFLIGSQFPLANRLYLGEERTVTATAGMLYASDLLGGWLGGMVGAVVLLPVLGLAGTSLTVGLLKMTSLIVVLALPRSALGKR